MLVSLQKLWISMVNHFQLMIGEIYGNRQSVPVLSVDKFSLDMSNTKAEANSTCSNQKEVSDLHFASVDEENSSLSAESKSPESSAPPLPPKMGLKTVLNAVSKQKSLKEEASWQFCFRKFRFHLRRQLHRCPQDKHSFLLQLIHRPVKAKRECLETWILTVMWKRYEKICRTLLKMDRVISKFTMMCCLRKCDRMCSTSSNDDEFFICRMVVRLIHWC